MAPGSSQKKERKVILFPLVNVQEDGNRSVTDCKMVQRNQDRWREEVPFGCINL